MSEKFYMIYVIDGRNDFTKKYNTEESAIEEATRLAREGKSVYILKPIKKLEMTEIKITNLENYEK